MTLLNNLVEFSKKVLYPNGEPYTFYGKKLLFVAGTRPVRRKYLNAESDVVRNDVLQINYFEANFKPGDVLWDIGSHKGHYSIFAATIAAGPNQVFSFEPDVAAREVQEKNIRLNHLADRITIFKTAVSNVKGVLKFKSMGGNANSHIIKDEQNSEPDIVSVDSTTIDALLEELPEPGFVKIDTEGAEVDIIRAASKLLANRNVHFICELHPFAWENFNVGYDEFKSTVEKYGRTIIPLDAKKSVTELPFYGTVLF